MREEGLLSLTSLPISMYPGRNRNKGKINETSQPNQSVSQSTVGLIWIYFMLLNKDDDDKPPF